MFVEEEADKVEVVENETSEPTTEQPVSPTETVDQTKAFAKRLKESTEKARADEREKIANSFGYASWDEYLNHTTNEKLIDKGFDPEAVRPVLQELIEQDPRFKEAMKYKAEKEEIEKRMFAEASIKQLNSVFGTKYTSVDDLDEDTVKDWNNGMSLEKAYAANHWNSIRDNAIKAAVSDNGKTHLKVLNGGSTESSKDRELMDGEDRIFAQLGVSKEDAKAFVNKHRTNK